MFEPELGLMVWTLISFFVLLFLLKKFAYKPILAFMEQREQSIKEAIEEAQSTHKAAKELLSQHKSQLEEGRREARKIIEEGRAIGENLKKDILTQASQESKDLVKKAQEEIEREKMKALIELQDSIADLSVQIASKIIQGALKPDDHLKLIEGSLAKMMEDYEIAAKVNSNNNGVRGFLAGVMEEYGKG